MYNDEEQVVLSRLGTIGLPMILLTDEQLPILANCYYWGKYPDILSQYLCARLMKLSEQHPSAILKGIKDSIYSSLGRHITLMDYLVKRGEPLSYQWCYGRNAGVLRDVWIKQTLAHYGTTVEQQLELSNVIV